MIQQRYRRDYVGEFVITNTTIRDGQKIQSRDWIDNSIPNQWITGRAAAIVGPDERFDHRVLEKHRGGLRGTKRLQTYGALSVWRDMRLDYYASTLRDDIMALSVAKHYQSNQFFSRWVNYHELTAVFTTASLCLDYPGHFHLIPHALSLSNVALPLYLAAFDGNTEIFMLGYSQELSSPDRMWIQDVESVLDTYPGVKFVLVGTETNQPKSWRQRRNVRCMTHRQFITYCDV